ncbi:hypothetical protein KC19_12G155800 [Ceratodon purpureus]|uniref:Uncharacterized protein n=1 Tax=Ceratodon purpureus TaxID=3225 RepID=A0A8T0GBA0_CERPU|nr:hypothetical protein KC19_12G155800 [Ceratodon purpureus]
MNVCFFCGDLVFEWFAVGRKAVSSNRKPCRKPVGVFSLSDTFFSLFCVVNCVHYICLLCQPRALHFFLLRGFMRSRSFFLEFLIQSLLETFLMNWHFVCSGGKLKPLKAPKGKEKEYDEVPSFGRVETRLLVITSLLVLIFFCCISDNVDSNRPQHQHGSI